MSVRNARRVSVAAFGEHEAEPDGFGSADVFAAEFDQVLSEGLDGRVAWSVPEIVVERGGPYRLAEVGADLTVPG